MTVVSLFVGVPWILMLWATGIRKAPKIPLEGWKTLLPIGAATRSATPARDRARRRPSRSRRR